MDVVQFQEFLAQLVSLQAAGLDAQHLIDEAKKAGKEEAMKEMPVVAPVDGAAPVVDVTPYSQEDMDAVKAELDKVKADDGATIESLKASLAKIDAILHPAPVEPVA